jgi:dTDP-4-amino-4,6-dideoxygalactose transaminase
MSATETKTIPIFDTSAEVHALLPKLMTTIEEVLKSGRFILGPETKQFEAEAAECLGVKHAIGVNSGTDALMIGMRTLGVAPGDEVITSPFSFFASAESISCIGAKPVFVDVDLDSMNLDPAKVEAAITPKTKAIMPVHIFGRPAEMGPIMEVAGLHGLKVIEDCAQSFGADIDGRFTGGIGHVGAFSFYPTKNLGAYGDGGLITTDDDDIAQQSRKLREHGSLIRYANEELGYNSRLDSLQAAILRIKLPLTEGYNLARRRLAGRYRDGLTGTSDVICPEVTPGHVFHQYTVRVTNGRRDAVAARMRELGVSTMIYYPVPQDRLPVYAGQYPRFANSDLLSEQVLSLPMWPRMDDPTQDHVIACLKRALAEA